MFSWKFLFPEYLKFEAKLMRKNSFEKMPKADEEKL